MTARDTPPRREPSSTSGTLGVIASIIASFGQDHTIPIGCPLHIETELRIPPDRKVKDRFSRTSTSVPIGVCRRGVQLHAPVEGVPHLEERLVELAKGVG